MQRETWNRPLFEPLRTSYKQTSGHRQGISYLPALSSLTLPSSCGLLISASESPFYPYCFFWPTCGSSSASATSTTQFQAASSTSRSSSSPQRKKQPDVAPPRASSSVPPLHPPLDPSLPQQQICEQTSISTLHFYSSSHSSTRPSSSSRHEP